MMRGVFVGYVVQGSNGEYVYQTVKERIQVVEHVAKTAAPGKVILAGSGCECKCSRQCMRNLYCLARELAFLVMHKSLPHDHAC